ncbi:TPA: hypothetical protein OL461_003580 [Clostridioides difficile]|nr:hypothetical protein [Clostridioides difficile]HCQ6147281.1 hypothetical protein [Clostridioides difficile]
MNQEKEKANDLLLKLELLKKINPQEFGYISGRIDVNIEKLKQETERNKSKKIRYRKGT